MEAFKNGIGLAASERHWLARNGNAIIPRFQDAVQLCGRHVIFAFSFTYWRIELGMRPIKIKHNHWMHTRVSVVPINNIAERDDFVKF